MSKPKKSEPKSKVPQVEVSPELRDAMQAAAEALGLTMSEFVRRALLWYLSELDISKRRN